MTVLLVAKDTPEFIVELLLTPYLLNAVRVAKAGIATKDIKYLQYTLPTLMKKMVAAGLFGRKIGRDFLNKNN
jgi:3-hydroxyacyl-CoA dehydrogenase